MNEVKPRNSAKKKQNKTAMQQNYNGIKIMALGGLGEVGKNCYVLEYNNKIVIIDFGVLFPNKDDLGIDYIIPNYKYLKENESKIIGLFITHGHEDHIGGIPFLLKKIKIPKIYAPQTALYMIEKKFKEHNITQDMQVIDGNTHLNFNEIKLDFFRITHSIPDALGMFIETPKGNVVTTGDFKIDFSPPGQDPADFHKMVELSKRGVLCLMSDSTNAQTAGFSPSESDIGKNLKTLISEAEGRILFTTFASNINRVEQIIEGALENNRKVCVLGRSLVNGLQIGKKTGYIKLNPQDVVDAKSLHKHNPEDIVIISTGSQGETLAALSRIANGLNQHIKLDENDTIVFASNPIPGNNYPIGRVIDSLSKTGCRIIRNSPIFRTHASGHASQEEQKLIITLFKPKYFVPIHGTFNMLQAHKKTGIQLGIDEKNIFTFDNGDIFFLDEKKPYIKYNQVPGKSLYVSGNNINVSTKDGQMNRLASDGIMLFSAIYDSKMNLISYPQITTRGFIVINESLKLLKEIQAAFLEQYHSNKKLKIEELQDVLTEKMSEFIYEKTDKLPLISTNLIAYNPFDEDNKPKENKQASENKPKQKTSSKKNSNQQTNKKPNIKKTQNNKPKQIMNKQN